MFGYRSFSELKSDVQSSIHATQQSANTAIAATQEQANREISKVRDEAAGIAKDEAHRRIDDAFAKGNVQQMLEEAVGRQAGAVIQARIRREVDSSLATLQSEVLAVSGNANAAMKMRIGLRAGLEELRTRTRTDPSAFVRSNAEELLNSIASDYESNDRAEMKSLKMQNAVSIAQTVGVCVGYQESGAITR